MLRSLLLSALVEILSHRRLPRRQTAERASVAACAVTAQEGDRMDQTAAEIPLTPEAVSIAVRRYVG